MRPDKANSHRVNSVAVILYEDNMGLSVESRHIWTCNTKILSFNHQRIFLEW